MVSLSHFSSDKAAEHPKKGFLDGLAWLVEMFSLAQYMSNRHFLSTDEMRREFFSEMKRRDLD